MERLKLSLDLKHDTWTYFVLYLVKWKSWNALYRKNEILAKMHTSLRNKKVNISLDLKHDIWTYFVLYSVKRKYWKDPFCEKEILPYLVTKFDKWEGWMWPWFKTWYVNLFGFVFGKMNVVEWPLRKNEILAYMLLSLRNNKVQLFLWYKTWYVNIFCFVFGKTNVMEFFLSRKRDLAYMVNFINGKVECVPWFKTSLWSYLVLYSVKWKYWNVPCRENEILAYMLKSLRNKKVNISLDLKHNIWTYFVLYSVKQKYWNDPFCENKILPYLVTKFNKWEGWMCPWFKTWYVNLFGFVFGKMNVLEWPLRKKWDFSLYEYMFNKYEGWASPSMSLDAKRDIWTSLVLNSVNIKYRDDPCRKKVILAYMVANLINEKVKIVPWFKTWYVNLFCFVFGKMKVLEYSLSRKWDFSLYASKFEK